MEDENAPRKGSSLSRSEALSISSLSPSEVGIISKFIPTDILPSSTSAPKDISRPELPIDLSASMQDINLNDKPDTSVPNQDLPKREVIAAKVNCTFIDVSPHEETYVDRIALAPPPQISYAQKPNEDQDFSRLITASEKHKPAARIDANESKVDEKHSGSARTSSPIPLGDDLNQQSIPLDQEHAIDIQKEQKVDTPEISQNVNTMSNVLLHVEGFQPIIHKVLGEENSCSADKRLVANQLLRSTKTPQDYQRQQQEKNENILPKEPSQRGLKPPQSSKHFHSRSDLHFLTNQHSHLVNRPALPLHPAMIRHFNSISNVYDAQMHHEPQLYYRNERPAMPHNQMHYFHNDQQIQPSVYGLQNNVVAYNKSPAFGNNPANGGFNTHPLHYMLGPPNIPVLQPQFQPYNDRPALNYYFYNNNNGQESYIDGNIPSNYKHAVPIRPASSVYAARPVLANSPQDAIYKRPSEYASAFRSTVDVSNGPNNSLVPLDSFEAIELELTKEGQEDPTSPTFHTLSRNKTVNFSEFTTAEKINQYRQKAMKSNDPNILFEYAKFIIINHRFCIESENGSTEEGFKFLKKIANSGHLESQFYLGQAYLDDERFSNAVYNDGFNFSMPNLVLQQKRATPLLFTH